VLNEKEKQVEEEKKVWKEFEKK